MRRNWNITAPNLWIFQEENKLSKKNLALMIEAFRRKHFLAISKFDKTPTREWLGLGTAAQYRSTLFTCSNGREIKERGIKNWYILTKEGEALMTEMERVFLIPTTSEQKNEVNDFLFYWN